MAKKVNASQHPGQGKKHKNGPLWVKPFLEALSEMPLVIRAAEAAGIERTTAYRHRDKSPEFAEAWENAVEKGLERYEKMAFDRAKESPDMLTFILRSWKAKRYREVVTHEVDKEIEITINHSVSHGSKPDDK